MFRALPNHSSGSGEMSLLKILELAPRAPSFFKKCFLASRIKDKNKLIQGEFKPLSSSLLILVSHKAPELLPELVS